MTIVELFRLLRKHLAIVVILPIVAAGITAAVSLTMLPDTYTARTSAYVLAKTGTAEGRAAGETATLSADLSAGQMITNDVASLIWSDRVKNDTAHALGLESLDGYQIGVESQTNTRVITISVAGVDPDQTAAVANGLASNVASVAQEVMNVESVNVIDRAAVPEKPSGPPRVLYTAIAFAAGLLAAVAIVVLMDLLNTKVRGTRDVEELLGIPVLGRMPAVKKGVL